MRLIAGVALITLLAALFAPTDSRAEAVDASPLTIERVECRGNVITRCEFIRAEVSLSAGSKLDEKRIDAARLRLSSLPNFKSVHLYLEKGSAKGRVVVVIEVAESNPFATAFLAGTSYRRSQLLQTFATRLSDIDLWGSGKTADLLAVGNTSLAGGEQHEYSARLDYIDPQLLGSDRYFLYSGLFYSEAGVSLAFGGANQSHGAGIDMSVGRRFGDFSYASIGYRYIFNYPLSGRFLASDGTITALTPSPHAGVLLTLGRGTEDDPSFPTRGWLLHLYDIVSTTGTNNFTLRYAGAQLRATWKGNGGYWTAQARPSNDFTAPFDDEFGYSISYSHNIDLRAGAGRARWYVGPGFTPGFESHIEIGLKAGLRFETRHFGVVDFYLIGSKLYRLAGSD
jgi:outer membrane protein assembly factor BamA